MGFTPRDIDRMSLWEYTACLTGYAKAHGAKEPANVSDADYERLVALGDLFNEERNG